MGRGLKYLQVFSSLFDHFFNNITARLQKLYNSAFPQNGEKILVFTLAAMFELPPSPTKNNFIIYNVIGFL